MTSYLRSGALCIAIGGTLLAAAATIAPPASAATDAVAEDIRCRKVYKCYSTGMPWPECDWYWVCEVVPDVPAEASLAPVSCPAG